MASLKMAFERADAAPEEDRHRVVECFGMLFNDDPEDIEYKKKLAAIMTRFGVGFGAAAVGAYLGMAITHHMYGTIHSWFSTRLHLVVGQRRIFGLVGHGY